MPRQNFDQTLSRFGLEKLKRGLDLQVTKGGDIAITRDGDLQLGGAQQNGLYRFVERWRHSEEVISELFLPMVKAAERLQALEAQRTNDTAPTPREPSLYEEYIESVSEAHLTSSTLGGAIAVIIHNLLMRLKKDVNASEADWKNTGPKFDGHSVGEIFHAAAANFRHYDEWAASSSPSPPQLDSMTVLCALLKEPVLTVHGHRTIRSNVCGSVLMRLSGGSIDELHRITIQYAKSLSKHC